MARRPDARLRATFLQELDEQVRELNSGLLALEQRPRDAELVARCSAPRTPSRAPPRGRRPAIEEACHALESVFAGVRDGRDTGRRRLLAAVRRVDALAEAGARCAAARTARVGTRSPRCCRASSALPRGLARSPAPHPRGRRCLGRPPARSGRPARTPEPSAPRRRPTELQRTGAERTGAGARRAGEELVRVRAERLDTLLSAVGELIIATGRIVERSGARTTTRGG
jgi:two-component system, chemotaxis family, sensor kinase CheA